MCLAHLVCWVGDGMSKINLFKVPTINHYPLKSFLFQNCYLTYSSRIFEYGQK